MNDWRCKMTAVNTLDETVDMLNEFIGKYEKILILDCGCILDKGLIADFIEYVMKINLDKRYLIIVNGIGVFERFMDECQVEVVQIPDQKFKGIINLYRTYEFSDRITFITDDNAFPNILNYLYTGVLSKQECFDALIR